MNDETLLNSRLNNLFQAELVQIELFYHGERYSISAENLPFVIGRDKSNCHLVVDSEHASRSHCTLEIRDSQIGIVDHSTNGTVVQVGRSNSVFVKERFYPLSGQGRLKMGADIHLGDPDLVLFKVTLKSGN